MLELKNSKVLLSWNVYINIGSLLRNQSIVKIENINHQNRIYQEADSSIRKYYRSLLISKSLFRRQMCWSRWRHFRNFANDVDSERGRRRRIELFEYFRLLFHKEANPVSLWLDKLP